MALISLALEARNATVGDFTVRRALPRRERRLVGPVCFLDHMGPHASVGTVDGGVAPHPHIGLSTVTFLFEGSVLHRDSLGSEQRIVPGDVNWMTAGAAIAHSERTPSELVGHPTRLHGLQLWVALPAALEEGPASFQHVPKAKLPALTDAGVDLTVVVGRWQGLESPVRTASPTLMVAASLEAAARLELDASVAERAVYVVSGTVTVDGLSYGAGTLLCLTARESGCVEALTDARVAVVGGEPLDGPRFMDWNFVSSRKETIAAAKHAWRTRQWPLIPNDSLERVPLPDEASAVATPPTS